MSGRISGHIRGNVVGYAAVFIALTGTAAALPGKNTVDSGDIKNGQVKTKDVADAAITNPKLAPNAVDASKVADGSLGTAEIDESNLDSSVLQRRVGGCNLGQSIRTIDQQGNVACEDDDAGGPPSGNAGGDLTGSYPNPTIGPNAVGTNEVDGSLTGADFADDNSLGGGEINEATLFGDNSLDAADINEGSLGLAAGRTAFDFTFIGPSPPGVFGEVDQVSDRFRVMYQCPDPTSGSGQVQFIRLTDGPMQVFIDDGGGNPTFVELNPPTSATTRVVSAGGDRIVFSYRGLINGNTQSVFGTVAVDSINQAAGCYAQSQALISG